MHLNHTSGYLSSPGLFESRWMVLSQKIVTKRISEFALEVFTEAWLHEHGFKMRANAPNRSETRADLLVHVPETGMDFILDLTVLQPKPFVKGQAGRSEIEDVEKTRFDRYLNNFHMAG